MFKYWRVDFRFLVIFCLSKFVSKLDCPQVILNLDISIFKRNLLYEPHTSIHFLNFVSED